MSEKTYRIGEAAELLNLKTHVLRFWETEFPQLDPLRTDKGQRLYTETHLALLRRIQQLLHEQGMTIEGAPRAGGQRGSGRKPARAGGRRAGPGLHADAQTGADGGAPPAGRAALNFPPRWRSVHTRMSA